MTMDYAKKSLSMLTPTSLSKCVTASVSASASMTQQLLGVTPRMRPFRVGNADRTIKKGIMADSLRDLLNKVMDGLHVSCVSALVLDEDGTGVDTEEFFQTLKDNTILIVLEKGQKWTPLETNIVVPQRPDRQPARRKDVAKLTFDLYKNHPQEFIGCLNVKATLYGIYSVSYDLRCYEAKRMIKEALRWTLFTMQTTGHVLVGTSCYMQKLLDEEEAAAAERHLKAPADRHLPGLLWGRSSF
ncbi:cell death activator CIDE-3-like isoform X2 [Denticeps clupeoides]|nr:cell death activator CIDE-3-like isoform X2 [Denticeps clupeoides]XP_028854721.1 cell death activator CIDE-3-like isoform X2 [Denticeps clupeoides]XP_028854722.1 cell death activator CIDE-3-like isoform X2 [Denticeps clupeoides]